MRIVEAGPNWTQRYIIADELDRRQPQGSPPDSQPVQDPLALVKQYYWRRYAEAIGQPDALPNITPHGAETVASITRLVDHTAAQVRDLYLKYKERLADFPPGVRENTEQYLNAVMVELTHGREDELEVTIKGFAQDDPLLRLGIIGRIIRRFFPSSHERVRRKVSSLAIQRINEASKQFLRDIKEKIG